MSDGGAVDAVRRRLPGLAIVIALVLSAIALHGDNLPRAEAASAGARFAVASQSNMSASAASHHQIEARSAAETPAAAMDVCANCEIDLGCAAMIACLLAMIAAVHLMLLQRPSRHRLPRRQASGNTEPAVIIEPVRAVCLHKLCISRT